MTDDSSEATALLLFDYGRSAQTWRKRWLAGEVADESPYSFATIAERGFRPVFARDHHEKTFVTVIRKAIRRVLGSDFVHVIRNRRAIAAADVVITHTEETSIAYVALRRLLFRGWPPVVAQVVWLADNIATGDTTARRRAVKFLRAADTVVTLSPANADYLAHLGSRPVEFAPFGVPVEEWESTEGEPDVATPAVLAVGNDKHRDWSTLAETARLLPRVPFLVLSIAAGKADVDWPANVEIRRARNRAELRAQTRAAAVVLLPLKSNFHASGITVVAEVGLAQAPMLVSRIGGLDAYLGDDFSGFLPAGASGAEWAERIEVLIRDDDTRTAAAAELSGIVRSRDLTATGYVARIAEIARATLAG